MDDCRFVNEKFNEFIGLRYGCVVATADRQPVGESAAAYDRVTVVFEAKAGQPMTVLLNSCERKIEIEE